MQGCCGVWRCCLTGVLVLYLCKLVLCKKHRRGETYGDLGDEIIVDDTPSRTNRKNEIPRVAYDDERDGHKIETRTITKNTLGLHMNPLLYRQFTSNPSYRRQYQVPVRIPGLTMSRIPARMNINRQHIPPWTRDYRIPPWERKNVIHRPVARRLSPAAAPPANHLRRPVATALRGKVQKPAAKAVAKSVTKQSAKPVTKTVSKAAIAQYQARKKWYQSHLAAAAASKKARLLPPKSQSQKRRIHVQVLLPRAPIRNAKQLGIHRGFVLMPARTQKRQPGLSSRTAAASRMPNDRFAEKNNMFIPAINSKHFNTPRKSEPIDVTQPVSDITSYHVDDIGNLIPDISDPKFFEPLQNKNRNPLAKSTSCRIPMKRDGRCPVPSQRFISDPRWIPGAAAKTNVARNQKPRPAASTRQQQLARQVKIPPRTSVGRKPAPAAAKSSQRILFFARKGQTAQQQQQQNMRYQLQARKQVRLPPPSGRQAPVVRPPVINARAQTHHGKAPTMFEVPKISNKVYNYISQRTKASAAMSAQKPVNPLLKYLQYHRTHPAPSLMVQPRQPNQRGMEKKSVVTIPGQ